RLKYQGQRIDVVIAMASPAVRFVLDHRSDLFPDAPIVFASVSAPAADLQTVGRGLTGVKVGTAYAATLKLALELHPSTEQVFVIARTGDPQVLNSVRAELQGFSQRVRLTYVDEPTVPRLVKAVAAIPLRSLVLYIWQSQDEPGNVIYSDEVARLVAQSARVPVYGTSDLYLGTGVVGGVMRVTEETGRRAGEMAREILEGRPARDLPIETARLVPRFDWRQLQRWGIPSSRLPAGSEILFKTPTAWESYGHYIVGLMFLVTAELLLIAALLTQHARRRRAEQTIRKREASLRKSYDRIRHLAGHLIDAQEKTRTSIARELHDGICQELASVSAAVGSLRSSSGEIQDGERQREFEKLEQETFGVFESIRRLSHDLHPATLRLVGLPAALRAHCREVAQRHAVQVNFTSEPDVGTLTPDVAICLFRIAQESLRNAVEHGGAARLDVSLAEPNGSVELTITDDGCGFDPDAIRANGLGLGLVSMEERAHLVGGEVRIVSAPGQGTTVRVRTPATRKPGGAGAPA
ncbi:MAG: ABC transporter substrate binding protein, partial [Acidobacteriota bacterium]